MKRSGLREARVVVAERSAGRCEAGTPVCVLRGSQAHHVQLRSQGGSHQPDNLLWVCSPCHDHIHAHPAESHRQGWLRRRAA